jgi:hypothetical protein
MGQFWLKSDTLLDDVQEQSRFQDHVCSLASRCKLGKLICFAHQWRGHRDTKRPRRPFGCAIAIGKGKCNLKQLKRKVQLIVREP